MDNKHNCDICNKTYSSYQSLWNHNKKFHKKKETKTCKCKYCGTIYKQQPSKSRHEKTCKYKDTDNRLINVVNENNELKNSIDELRNDMNKIKININPNRNINKNISPNINPIINLNKNNDEHSYIYLLQCLDINTNKLTYKIERTSREIKKRLCEYSNSYKILLTTYVPDSVEIEKKLLNMFKNDNKICQNKKMGVEYFCCDDYLYIYSIILNTVYNKIIINNTEEIITPCPSKVM